LKPPVDKKTPGGESSLNMSRRVKIKVIKKGAVKFIEAPAVTGKARALSRAAQLASTVSGWISESRHQRQREMESLIEKFYA
jgi:hypothetical protein